MPPSPDLKTAIERIRSTPFPDNERAVEIKVILPLLTAQGWDVHGETVRYQYKVGGSKSRNQGVVDIALFGARGALCFIEAKNTDERLDNHVGQLLGYAFYEGVVLCALTNGREWWFYLPREGGRPETRKFAALNMETDSLDSLAEQMHLFLAKSNLESGRAEKFGRQRLSEKRERDIWQEMLAKPDRTLVQTITDRIEKETGDRPSGSRVAALLAETRFEVAVTTSDVAASSMTTGEENQAGERNGNTGKRKKAPKVKGVRLWGEFQETNRWSSAYMLVANELYKRHPDKFLETVNSNSKGGKYPWFADNKEACSTPLLPAKFLEDSSPRIYAYVHGSGSTLTRKTERLLEMFGYPSDDPNIWEIVTE